MKKYSLILFFLITLGAKAQGNLQFNQVITKSGYLTCGSSSDVLTVPSGKVWKLEYYTNSNDEGGFHIYINNIQFVSGTDSRPVWLKSQDNLRYSQTTTIYGTCYPTYYFLSIIEFNITQ